MQNRTAAVPFPLPADRPLDGGVSSRGEPPRYVVLPGLGLGDIAAWHLRGRADPVPGDEMRPWSPSRRGCSDGSAAAWSLHVTSASSHRKREEENRRDPASSREVRREVSLPLQQRRPHLSCGHRVHAHSTHRASEPLLPERALPALRPLPSLPRNPRREAGKVARAARARGAHRRRDRWLSGKPPRAEALGDAPAMQPGETSMRAPLGGWWSPAGATLFLLLCLGLVPPVRADVSPSLRCRRGTVRVRTDMKTCPTERGRPASTVERACCQGRSGKIQCMHYPQCPTRSPS